MVWDLSAWQKGINSLGKNDKRESSQKVGLKKWNLEALEKERTKVSFLGSPQNGKVNKGLFEEGTSKEENNEE